MRDIPLISTMFSLLGLGQQPFTLVPTIAGDRWDHLNSSVSGRLYTTGKTTEGGPCEGLWTVDAPAVKPKEIGLSFLDKGLQTQLDTCLGKADNFTRYFVDVQTPADVAAAISFTQQNGVPLVASNLATDFCRSTAPTSLALWTDNLNDIKYVPRFIPKTDYAIKSVPAITFGVGASMKQLATFADSLQMTVVTSDTPALHGGSPRLQGAGTSFLSPTLGLVVDNILEFEVVTADGVFRKVNAYQDKDLWFALRGGGDAASFAVVLRMTVLAHPKVKLQTFSASFASSPETTRALLDVATRNAVRWANEGWGGFIRAQDFVLTTPKLSHDEARESMKPLAEFVKTHQGKGGDVAFVQHESYLELLNMVDTKVKIEKSAERAISSRLIPDYIFANELSRQDLVKAIITGSKAVPSWSINVATPYKFQSIDSEISTSVTPAFYESVWNVVFSGDLRAKAIYHDRLLQYSAVSKVTTFLRYITPKSGTHFAEGDFSEPNREQFFWGFNYQTLLRIKSKFDPQNILTTWNGVGAKGQSADPRFSCYTPTRLTWVRCDRSCR